MTIWLEEYMQATPIEGKPIVDIYHTPPFRDAATYVKVIERPEGTLSCCWNKGLDERADMFDLLKLAKGHFGNEKANLGEAVQFAKDSGWLASRLPVTTVDLDGATAERLRRLMTMDYPLNYRNPAILDGGSWHVLFHDTRDMEYRFYCPDPPVGLEGLAELVRVVAQACDLMRDFGLH